MSCIVSVPFYIQLFSKEIATCFQDVNFLLMRVQNNSGLQPRAVQGMLDFDFVCKRTTPSVAGIIYTFGGQFVSKMSVPYEIQNFISDIASS